MKDKYGRTVTEKKHWTCKDCGKDTFLSSDIDYYMVTHKLWKKYGVGNDMLCVGCMEERLGRKLTKKDLLDCALNTDVNDYTRKIWKSK